tara:strand:- start:20 stop:1078 length:1059 start_codon:yes stop_codon:yes gene_type:complete
MSQDQLTIRQPDDWHCHLRDGPVLKGVVSYTTRYFKRAIVMPNLDSPITTISAAKQYRQRILDAIPKDKIFIPLMTAYLTDDLAPDVLEKGKKDGVFVAAKLYPANATTNSSKGVSDLRNIRPLLEIMEKIDMPLLIHGEVTDPEVDLFDREAVFIERHLKPLLKNHPGLRVVLEHITTEEAVKFVEFSSHKLAATITPHHLHINRNAMFSEGFRSDFYCLPVAKRERHRQELRRAATSGKPCFFLGTDSAPHTRPYKENSCSCAGIFNAPYALESYAKVFEEEESLSKLENFCSVFGPNFYGLPLNKDKITLERKSHIIPKYIEFKDEKDSLKRIVPFHSREVLDWHIPDN